MDTTDLPGAELVRQGLLDLASGLESVAAGLVDRAELMRLFERIEPDLYRFPAVSPPAFRRAVEAFVARPA